MSSTSKSSKYIIWLDKIDSYVEEGSGKPSLFSTKGAAAKCAKELWPKTKWHVRRFSYIKQAKKRQDKEDKVHEKDRGTMVTSQGFPYRFKPPSPSKPICVFLFEQGKERRSPNYSAKTLAEARKWAAAKAKKFIIKAHPDREISILDCSNPNLPTWTDLICLPVDLQEGAKTDARPVIADKSSSNLSESSKTQPTPYQNSKGYWVCPITEKVYQACGKQLFTHIIKAAEGRSQAYLPVVDWKAFLYKGVWICPYTGKVFKRTGKHLDNHITKQRQLLKGS